jgi:hypothetical protein
MRKAVTMEQRGENTMETRTHDEIRMQSTDESWTCIRAWVPGTNIADDRISATIAGIKPERT